MYQKKTDKRAIQSSLMIYEALVVLMKEKEYPKITVIDLVNQANIGRTTFYRNFNTIDDILRFKCIEMFSEFRNYCIQYYQKHTDEEFNFIKPFLIFWCDHSEIIELLIKAERETILKDCLREEVRYFINRASFDEDSMISKHLNYFIEIRVSNSVSILTEYLNEGKKLSPEELALIINQQLKEAMHSTMLA